MDLHLDTTFAEGYKSPSQIAMRITEPWFAENMYCPACPSNGLEPLKANTKVIDFECTRCEETYQLKSTSKKIGNRILNSEYHTKVKKLEEGLSPNWALLEYDRERYEVKNLTIIPGYFMTLEAIQPRKPLKETARRAGWVGSNIHLDRLAPEGRLAVVVNGEERERRKVRKEWRRFEFYRRVKPRERGWLTDVHKCVREIGKGDFTLAEVYGYEGRLQELHPGNQHVRAKIRQQLQVLRDEGVVEFAGRGRYQVR